MALQVTCRDCGHVNQVDLARAGRKYLCGGCGIMGSLPASSGSPSESAEGSVVRFHCPSCGRKYATNAELAGKKIRCKGCGAGVRVPGAGTGTGADTSHSAMKAAGSSSQAIASQRSDTDPMPASPHAEDDTLSLLDDLAALEGGKGRKRTEAVLPSRSEAMEQVRQKVAEQEAAEALKKEAKAKRMRKKKKGSSYFDPKDTLILAGGVTGFVAVLAFLSWGYPDLRFPVGGFMCVLGFIVYLLGAASIKQIVAEEGFHHVVLFRFFPPYQWYFVATRWSETKDFVAFFAAGLIILGIGGAVLKTSPIGKKAEASERAYQKVHQGSDPDTPPAVSGAVVEEDK
ncbi:hypothetical protein SAMN05444166_5947 [Singulisphaera sp. GP187]|uniref:hypothetical protein n=1 Tax=Singulisphaera sp. GP187 TaxID=1882752 RepID=UPI00092BCDCB|nr:hypothetical protein [Singulisphaera sp. GP187]SIO59162.1 hypothetical protein SAMN05444166_5947 [Singulisphaera sp. GP187]